MKRRVGFRFGQTWTDDHRRQVQKERTVVRVHARAHCGFAASVAAEADSRTPAS
jgi:hypothetical protein